LERGWLGTGYADGDEGVTTYTGPRGSETTVERHGARIERWRRRNWADCGEANREERKEIADVTCKASGARGG